jgi:glucose/arabinose dehydrogenase
MKYLSSLFFSMSLVVMLVLATPARYNLSASAQTSSPSVKDSNLKVEKVVDGLIHPTAMAFLDEHRLLLLEKDSGRVRMVKDGKLLPDPLLDVAVANQDERGMLGIAISKENNATTYVFVYFTQSGGGVDGDDNHGVQPAGNRLYRYELQGEHLVHPKLLLKLPSNPGETTGIIGRYVGGPVAVGPDGFVYVVIGDVDHHKTKAENFQNGPPPDGTGGILRIGKNGEIPPSVIGSGNFSKYYYAYGIRNSFGMTFDPMTGKLWDTENGPAFGDEVNLVEPGFNSGWAKISGMASNENPEGLVLFNAKSHYGNPEFSWTKTVAPTAIVFLNSNRLGNQYQNDIFVGDFNNGAIYKFKLNDTRTGFELKGNLADKVANTPEENADITFATGFGGITDIKTGPEGSLYVLSYADGAIYRILSSNSSLEGNNKATHTKTAPAELYIKSADLSGRKFSGMYAIVGKQCDNFGKRICFPNIHGNRGS